jgi:hypothetical protein
MVFVYCAIITYSREVVRVMPARKAATQRCRKRVTGEPKTIDVVYVQRERDMICTRGTWEDSYKFYEAKPLPAGVSGPALGRLKSGIWDYEKRWRGYTEHNLKDGTRRSVTVGEVSSRFKHAMHLGDRFPFLHPLSFRTLGWVWDPGRVQQLVSRPGLPELVGSIIEAFLLAAAEAAPSDITVELTADPVELRVLDGTPGGNGMSEALLLGGRVADALRQAARLLKRLEAVSVDRYQRHITDLCGSLLNSLQRR